MILKIFLKHNRGPTHPLIVVPNTYIQTLRYFSVSRQGHRPLTASLKNYGRGYLSKKRGQQGAVGHSRWDSSGGCWSPRDLLRSSPVGQHGKQKTRRDETNRCVSSGGEQVRLFRYKQVSLFRLPGYFGENTYRPAPGDREPKILAGRVSGKKLDMPGDRFVQGKGS